MRRSPTLVAIRRARQALLVMQRLARDLILALFGKLRGLTSVFLLVVLAGSALSAAGRPVCSQRVGVSSPQAGAGSVSLDAVHAHPAPADMSVPRTSAGCVTIVALPAAAATAPGRTSGGAVDGTMSRLRTGHHPPPPFHPPRLS